MNVGWQGLVAQSACCALLISYAEAQAHLLLKTTKRAAMHCSVIGGHAYLMTCSTGCSLLQDCIS